MYRKGLFIFVLTIIFLISGYLKFWNINFGLPHSFYADEPEFVEFAISYTFQIKEVITNSNWYKFIPVSYVYGTFPIYFFTIITIIFTQIMSILDFTYNKTDLYVLLRSANAILTLGILPIVFLIYLKVFKDKIGAIFAAILIGLNWKLISHAHYVNADVFITLLITISILFFVMYIENFNIFKEKNESVYIAFASLFLGLAIGSKITAIIAIPIYWFLILKKKDLKSFIAFNFIVFGVCLITNPFSFIFMEDYKNRITTMATKEAGMVFDSVDLNPFKYIYSLSYMVTIPIFLISLFGIYLSVRDRSLRNLNIFLIGYIMIYVLFFSMQVRLVERWLLPVIPIIILYSSFGLSYLWILTITVQNNLKFKILGILFFVSILSYYAYFSYVLIEQFQRNTPKSESYLWMKDKLGNETTLRTLVYTEEGLDPLNKLPNSNVIKFQVYENEGAGSFLPQNPYMYNYIILSSRPMENYKKHPVKTKYPEYYKAWVNFEDEVLKSGNFKLIKEFKTTKPNLIPLSEVRVYENLKPLDF